MIAWRTERGLQIGCEKRKPAFIIGSPQCRTKEHIQWCCSLYKLQAEEGRLFVHEQTMGASAWKLQCLQEVEELCSSDFDPQYGNRLLLTVSSDESTREAEKARVLRISVGVKVRNQCVRTLEEKEKSSLRILTNSKCLTDEMYFRDND